MPSRHPAGVLDTSVFIDLASVDPTDLPERPELTAITMAELHQGVALARNGVTRAQRLEKLRAAINHFEPLPFDGDAASRYGTLVELTLAAGRHPRPRRLDLMIASVASVRGLALFTRNAADFLGLEAAVTVIGV